MKNSILKKLVISAVLVLLVVFGVTVGAGFAKEPLKLNLPHADNIGDPLDRCCEYFAQIAEEVSGGNIQIKVFPAGQLGNHGELIEGCFLGSQPLVKVNLASTTHYGDFLTLMDLPFLFKNREHVAEVMSGPIGDELIEIYLKETGMRILSWFGSGFQGFYAKKPIKTLDDMKGMNMRVMDSPSRLDSMNAYGAQAVNIPWPEAYAAFQQGVADGGENAIPIIYGSKQHEVLPYFTESKHFYGLNVIVINEKYFQSLTNDQKNILIGVGKIVQPYGRIIFVKSEEELRVVMEKEGVTFFEIEPSEREKFREKVLPVWDKYANTPEKKDILKRIQEIGEKL